MGQKGANAEKPEDPYAGIAKNAEFLKDDVYVAIL